MTYIGYTTPSAIGRLNDLAKPAGDADEKGMGAVRTAVQSMEANLLGPAPSTVGAAGLPVIGAASPARVLQATLGMSRDKAGAISAYLNPKDKVAQQCLARMQRNAGDLTPHLHFSKQSRLSPAARVVARAALCLAFGHGANQQQLGKLHAHLEAAGDGAGLARFVVQVLKKPDADVGELLEKLGWPGQPFVDDTDLNRSKSLAGNDDNWKVMEKLARKTVSKERLENTHKNVELLAAVSNYTFGGYSDLNKHLLGVLKNDAQKPAQESYAKVMDYALAQLPDWSGMTMRGVDLPADFIANRYVVGATLTEPFFISSSANESFDKQVQFVFHVEHGKKITDLSTNQSLDGIEILIPRDTQFKILANEKVGDRTVVVLSEVGY